MSEVISEIKSMGMMGLGESKKIEGETDLNEIMKVPGGWVLVFKSGDMLTSCFVPAR